MAAYEICARTVDQPIVQVWLSKSRRLTQAAILSFAPHGFEVRVSGEMHPRELMDLTFVLSGHSCASAENAVTLTGADVYYVTFGRTNPALRQFLMDMYQLRDELRVEFLRTVLHQHLFVGGDAPDIPCAV